jgi:hypothetical protein
MMQASTADQGVAYECMNIIFTLLTSSEVKNESLREIFDGESEHQCLCTIEVSPCVFITLGYKNISKDGLPAVLLCNESLQITSPEVHHVEPLPV